MKEITKWLSDDDLNSIYTSTYWNNIEEEKKKDWWVEDGDYDKCLDFLKRKQLLDEYKQSEAYIKSMRGDSLKVVDLAAGIGWTSALLSKLPNVSEVHAIDISKHRLEILFEHSIKMLGGCSDKILRYLGSFYDLKFEDKSMDIIYMSQAFHHAENPIKLLIECDRALKPGGRIILVGEHHIGPKSILRKMVSNLIRKKTIKLKFHEIFPPDPISGDHYYRISDYYFMFNSLAYKLNHHQAVNGKLIYIADKQ